MDRLTAIAVAIVSRIDSMVWLSRSRWSAMSRKYSFMSEQTRGARAP